MRRIPSATYKIKRLFGTKIINILICVSRTEYEDRINFYNAVSNEVRVNTLTTRDSYIIFKILKDNYHISENQFKHEKKKYIISLVELAFFTAMLAGTILYIISQLIKGG